MKKLLLASCATLAVFGWGTAASAGDIGLMPGHYDWNGGYVGVNMGAALNTTTVQSNYTYTGSADIAEDERSLINDLDFKSTANDAFFTAGMLAGYNWQYGSFVIGGEADINYIGFDQTATHNVTDVMSQVMAPEGTGAKDKVEYTADWFGTVRARLGYAADNVLIYGTGGVAYGQMKIKQELDASNDVGEAANWSSSISNWNAGWTLGGGIEYAYDRWVLGAEYLYVDLGTYDWGSKGTVDLADSTLQDDWSQVKQNSKADFTFSVARATVKYRF